MLSKEQITAVLTKHVARETISGVVINGGKIGFALQSQDENLRERCEKAIFSLPGVEKVTAVLTGAENRIIVENKNTAVLDRRQALPGVNKIIAIAAGKGGVGKSTMAVNLAVAAAASGLKVALVDADIYGPSLPLMLGINQKPELRDGKMLPLSSNNISCNSIGFLVDAKAPTIWRGPMATKALHQLLLGTEWNNIDVMFLDLPPGTGDIQLTLAQNYKIDGAIMITTPQEVALADVRKAAQMFARVDIPILGVIENMSYFTDNAGEKNYIFGEGGGKKLAAELKIPLLGQVPLDPTLRKNADAGTPQVNETFKKIINQLKPIA
jgi:ATP-binding protein involved in chromosome partitioning